MKGSIVERKTSKGKKKYYIVVDLPHLTGQKRQQKWFSSWDKKRDAEKALPDILKKVSSSTYADNQTVTMHKLITDYLYKSQLCLSKSTLKRYKGCCTRIEKEFGQVAVAKIQPYNIENYFRDLQTEGFKPTTLQKHKSVLEQLFTYAKELRIIEHSPVPRLRVAKNNSAEHTTWSIKEVHEFLSTIKGQPLYMPVLLAAMTGMRAGEILALKWKDIDFDTHMLTVNKSKDYDGTLKAPKNKSSRRPINLTSFVVAELQAHRLEQKKAKLQYGMDYYKSDFICTLADGKPMSCNYLTTTFKRKVRQYKFVVLRFHDLRHTFATISLTNGVHAKVVQEILGHSSIKVTMDTYSHVLPTVHSESMNKIEKAFSQ